MQTKEKKFTKKELFKGKGGSGAKIKTEKKVIYLLLLRWLRRTPRRQWESTLMNWKSSRKLWGQQDLSSDLKPLDYVNWGVLENKKYSTSHPNIGLPKTAIEEEWNKMSEEFILKACKLFRRHVDTITEKMVAVLSKFSVLYVSSYFVFYFFKLKLILFYDWIIHYYTRVFLILFPHSIHLGTCHKLVCSLVGGRQKKERI